MRCDLYGFFIIKLQIALHHVIQCTITCDVVQLCHFFRQFWCNFCGLRNLANNFRYCCHFISFAQNNLRVKFATKTIKETIKNRNNFFECKQWRRGGIRIWTSKYVQKRVPILNFHSNPKSLSFLDLINTTTIHFLIKHQQAHMLLR